MYRIAFYDKNGILLASTRSYNAIDKRTARRIIKEHKPSWWFDTNVIATCAVLDSDKKVIKRHKF